MLACAFSIFLFKWFNSKYSFTHNGITVGLATALITFTVISMLLLSKIDPARINVDRWSAIHNFLVYLFDGRYPYDALTQRGQYASPFPIWIFLHIPFFFLGDVGYAQIFFFIITVFSIAYFTGSRKFALLFCLLMLASPAFWYEVAVRSDFMSNMLVTLILILFFISKKVTFNTNPIALPIIVGLALSTRLIVILPMTVFLFSSFWTLHRHPIKLVKVAAIAMVTFLITFLPFILWDIRHFAFLHHNPFILQTNKLSAWIVLLFLALAMVISMKEKTSKALMEGVVFVMVGMMSVYLIQNWLEHGWNTIIFHDAIDLAYVSCALPFAVAGLTARLIAFRYDIIFE